MSRFPQLIGEDFMKFFRKQGFTLSHVRGSHHYLRKPVSEILVCIPVHK